MALEVTGKVYKVLAEQSGVSKTGTNWVKQEFVIETDEQYPKKICISAMGDKLVPVVKTLAPGAQITVHINLESREYNERWYSEIRAWRIDKAAAGASAAPAGDPFTPAAINTDEPGDDLPF